MMKRNALTGICMSVVILFAVCMLAGGVAFAGSSMGKDMVDLNTATVKELSSLPGIGKKRAQAIIAYRTENNRFESIDEIRTIEGIGKKTFEKIKERIAVE